MSPGYGDDAYSNDFMNALTRLNFAMYHCKFFSVGNHNLPWLSENQPGTLENAILQLDSFAQFPVFSSEMMIVFQHLAAALHANTAKAANEHLTLAVSASTWISSSITAPGPVARVGVQGVVGRRTQGTGRRGMHPVWPPGGQIAMAENLAMHLLPFLLAKEDSVIDVLDYMPDFAQVVLLETPSQGTERLEREALTDLPLLNSRNELLVSTIDGITHFNSYDYPNGKRIIVVGEVHDNQGCSNVQDNQFTFAKFITAVAIYSTTPLHYLAEEEQDREVYLRQSKMMEFNVSNRHCLYTPRVNCRFPHMQFHFGDLRWMGKVDGNYDPMSIMEHHYANKHISAFLEVLEVKPATAFLEVVEILFSSLLVDRAEVVRALAETHYSKALRSDVDFLDRWIFPPHIWQISVLAHAIPLEAKLRVITYIRTGMALRADLSPYDQLYLQLPFTASLMCWWMDVNELLQMELLFAMPNDKASTIVTYSGNIHARNYNNYLRKVGVGGQPREPEIELSDENSRCLNFGFYREKMPIR